MTLYTQSSLARKTVLPSLSRTELAKPPQCTSKWLTCSRTWTGLHSNRLRLMTGRNQDLWLGALYSLQYFSKKRKFMNMKLGSGLQRAQQQGAKILKPCQLHMKATYSLRLPFQALPADSTKDTTQVTAIRQPRVSSRRNTGDYTDH